MAEIREVDIAGDRQKRVRRILGRSLRSHLGGEIAGFALVTWDNRGACQSSYLASVGPVAEGLMPSFVKDALNRHLAVTLAQTVDSNQIDGDE